MPLMNWKYTSSTTKTWHHVQAKKKFAERTHTKSAGACLPWGTKAAWFGIMRFLTIIGQAFSYQAICCCAVLGLESDVDYPLHINISRSVPTPKIIYFEICFQGTRNQKNRSRGFKTSSNIGPTIHKKLFLRKMFLQYFPCEDIEHEASSVEIWIQKSIKR